MLIALVKVLTLRHSHKDDKDRPNLRDNVKYKVEGKDSKREEDNANV